MHMRLGAANCITAIRLLLVLLVGFLLAASHAQHEMLLLILSFLILNYIGDFLDGYLARRLNQVTKFGAIFDVSVDALLLLSAYFILAYKGVIKYHLFYLTAASFLQFVLSSLWIKKSGHKKTVFTFDVLGHYSIVLIEAMLIFNIGAVFITVPSYVNIVYYVDTIVIIIGVIAVLNRFRYYLERLKYVSLMI